MITPIENTTDKTLKTKQLFLRHEHNSKWKRIAKTISDWSLTCTFHCYPKIYQYENKLVKMFWALLFCVMMCPTGFLVIKCLMDYLDYDVVSKILVVNEVPAKFPVVTICDSNPFTTRQAAHFLEETLLPALNGTGFTSDRIFYFAKFILASAHFNDSFKQSLGLPFRVFSSCKFNQQDCDLSRDFSRFYSFDYGNCFQFNSGLSHDPPKTTSFPGEKYGLELLIGPLINENEKYLLAGTKGLKVFIHNQSFSPSYFDDALSLELGKQTNLAIRRTFAYNQPKPYGQCDDTTGFKSDLYDHMISSTGQTSYLQSHCMNMCFQRQVIEQCHCYFPGFPFYDTPSVPHSACSNFNELECFLKMKQLLDTQTFAMKQQCELECPLECDSVEYSIETSSLDYMHIDHYNTYMRSANVNATFTFDEYKQSMLFLFVYYPTMQYTEIRQAPKTSLVDLVSNLGGVIGVFLGFSVFSLVEIVELFLQVVLISINK